MELRLEYRSGIRDQYTDIFTGPAATVRNAGSRAIAASAASAF